MSVLSVKIPFWLPSRSELPAMQIVKLFGCITCRCKQHIAVHVALPPGMIRQADFQVPKKCSCCSGVNGKRVGGGMLSVDSEQH